MVTQRRDSANESGEAGDRESPSHAVAVAHSRDHWRMESNESEGPFQRADKKLNEISYLRTDP
jgi:hypothetical protein